MSPESCQLLQLFIREWVILSVTRSSVSIPTRDELEGIMGWAKQAGDAGQDSLKDTGWAERAGERRWDELKEVLDRVNQAG